MISHLDKINDFIEGLNPETLSVLNDISVEKRFQKGEFLLRQYEICKKSHVIKSGIARKFYLNDGKEITTELYFKDDIAVSFGSYCLQNPSVEYIQTLTDTVVSQTDYNAFQNAKQQFPELVKLDLMMTEYHAMWLENRLFQFHTMDATYRYHTIIKDYPHIVQNIPLTFIASYLGISLETLSRIRAKK